MADAADPISELRDHIDRRFDQVDAELRDHIDRRFDQVDAELRDHIGRRFDQVDAELRDVKRIVGTTKVETSALIDEVANINRKLLAQD